MAFSTQKDFFHVPFMNELPDYECKKACVKLKSYESSLDYRSWARDKTKQSKFLQDLVACELPVGAGEEPMQHGDNRETRIDKEIVKATAQYRDVPVKSDNVARPPVKSEVKPMAIAKSTPSVVSSPSHPKKTDTANADEVLQSHTTVHKQKSKLSANNNKAEHLPVQQMPNLSAGDSLLQCATIHLTDYQRLMNVKDSLEKQLMVSQERLETTTHENFKIKEILASKLDSNISNDFNQKIQKLIASGKLNKNEENEMLQIHQKMENILKVYEIRQAENNYLRRLIEKLTLRATIEDIAVDNETSSDLNYLHKEINALRRECKLLRSMEDEYLRNKMEKPQTTSLSDEDAKNIKKIIEERNALRNKCKSLQALEHTVAELQHKTHEKEKTNNALHNNLQAQGSYIQGMESEMEKLHTYYRNELQQVEVRERCLKEQLKDLQNELILCKCQLQRVESLQRENDCLHKELAKRDMALHDYDCQYKQLMDVVKEFQALKLQGLQDNQTQTCKNLTDDLAFFTHATLEEIMKELKRRGCTKDDYESAMHAYGLAHGGTGGGGSSNEEILRLQKELDQMKTERDQMCSEALQRLQELEAENENLKQDNIHLRESTKDADEKLTNVLKKVEHLDGELNLNKDELRKSAHELSEAKRLVEDISNIHLQNQQLVNAMGAINSRDDEKIIDDLRRQLEEEMAKLKACQMENQQLVKRVIERENEMKALKELNNKLQQEAELGGVFKKGLCFEKQRQKIMDEYKQELDFCCSRFLNPKNKFSVICYKLLHEGIASLSFSQLAYMHKKIYAYAELKTPGCLLDIILKDHREEALGILNVNLPCPASGDYDETNRKGDLLPTKCCSCKHQLCCNKSEEMIKEKVWKLEQDVKTVGEYLKKYSMRKNSTVDILDGTNSNEATYRAKSPPIQRKSSKRLKKLCSKYKMIHSDMQQQY
ncbi:uncharacterized protein [Musca autumnalis]|uniref:uncharacterized protein n=1 Tax=Musca autumnalis TaxID=221902 RepID=UPI003CE9FD61